MGSQYKTESFDAIQNINECCYANLYVENIAEKERAKRQRNNNNQLKTTDCVLKESHHVYMLHTQSYADKFGLNFFLCILCPSK